MLPFDYQNTTRLVFGAGIFKNIGNYLGKDCGRVLVHFGQGSIVRNGVYDGIAGSLNEAGINFVTLGGVKPNPRVDLVREGIRLCRDKSINFILAVGGGSVIDSAKAIAAGFYSDTDVWELLSRRQRISRALPLAAILTLPASGSESSCNSVITNEETGQKLGYGSPHIRPVFSIIDPELFYTLPKNQIANGVADMIAHILERYFSNTPGTALIDGMAESVLRTIIAYAPKLIEDPRDEDAWSQISLAGNFAHNGILGLGREEDWACHHIEHELSAAFDIAHGAGLAIIFPAWMKYIYREKLPWFGRFAVNVMGVCGSACDIGTAEEGVRRFETFLNSLGLPSRLKDVGIGEGHFDELARKASTYLSYKGENTLGSFRRLNRSDIRSILELAK